MMRTTEFVFFISDVIVAILAVSGNLLIIFAFAREKSLRTTTNSYILSLAITDLLVGAVGIPFSLFTMITQKPDSFLPCVLFNTWIMMLCTVSILHLLAVSYDRYLVIVRHSQDSPQKKRRRSGGLIAAAWVIGGLIGLLPIMGWNQGSSENQKCVFMEIMDLGYLFFLYVATIITPTVLMAVCYTGIYLGVRKHDSETRTLSTASMNGVSGRRRMEQRRRRIITSLLIVIVTFLIGWYPLYTVMIKGPPKLNSIAYFHPNYGIHELWFFGAIVLTHATSAVNPLIYAHTMPGFREAFQRIICCQTAVAVKTQKPNAEDMTLEKITFLRKLSVVTAYIGSPTALFTRETELDPSHRRFSNINPLTTTYQTVGVEAQRSASFCEELGETALSAPSIPTAHPRLTTFHTILETDSHPSQASQFDSDVML